ncbi:hypothetical protein AA0111_g942 [Alternaria arborescens]|uniref:hypothetical protein n=1 Tax=Alternaria arborescens TaxID=156630 RepID=UPI0010756348|nr:hypothetical protein AA0111_g942 [Alternaria arborescens]RYO40922.1 hypothetical protein AA0111_g942 [Alternaria arborescens]
MAPIVFNRPISPTPDSVMGEVVDNICQQWDIDDAWQALPNGLSYNHAEYAMAWGQPFLILLSALASLTPGKLEEVQKRLRKRIDHGRKTKGRHSWVMPDDLKTLVELYRRKQPTADRSANKGQKSDFRHRVGKEEEQSEGELADDEHEIREQYMSDSTLQTSDAIGGIAASNDDQDGEYNLPSCNSSSGTATSTTLAHSEKRKRGPDLNEQDIGKALQVRDDIEFWREAVPVAPAPRTQPPVTSVSDSLRTVDMEQRFEIPPEFTPEQKIELLHILRRRNRSLVKVAELDFRIRLEEMRLSQ